MTDRRLRQLLREAQQGLVPLQDYVAATSRVMPLEEVVATLQGFDTGDIRLAVRLVWIPVYAAQSKKNKSRVALAGVLGDPIAKTVAPSRRIADFPTRGFFWRNRNILSDTEWRLYAADCAEHLLPSFESHYPEDFRPRLAIAATRAFTVGQITSTELAYTMGAANAAAARALLDEITEAYKAASLATEVAHDRPGWSVATSQFHVLSLSWQRERLIDYLTGLSALLWPT